jgi:hypothetical protein
VKINERKTWFGQHIGDYGRMRQEIMFFTINAVLNNLVFTLLINLVKLRKKIKLV